MLAWVGAPRKHGRRWHLLGGSAAIPTTDTDVVLGVPADLLRRRPDVRRAERVAAAAGERIGIAQADFYPSFTLSGSTGFQTSAGYDSETGGRPDLQDIFDADSFTGFIDFGFSWPVLDYGRIASNVCVQDARFQQAAIAYRDVVLLAAAEVENGLIGFLRSQEQAHYLLESVEAARRSAELARAQYRDGAIDYTRVLQTETALVIQEDGWAVARGTIAGNLISLYRALGGGWELRSGHEFVAPEIAKEMRSRVNWGGRPFD